MIKYNEFILGGNRMDIIDSIFYFVLFGAIIFIIIVI